MLTRAEAEQAHDDISCRDSLLFVARFPPYLVDLKKSPTFKSFGCFPPVDSHYWVACWLLGANMSGQILLSEDRAPVSVAVGDLSSSAAELQNGPDEPAPECVPVASSDALDASVEDDGVKPDDGISTVAGAPDPDELCVAVDAVGNEGERTVVEESENVEDGKEGCRKRKGGEDGEVVSLEPDCVVLTAPDSLEAEPEIEGVDIGTSSKEDTDHVANEGVVASSGAGLGANSESGAGGGVKSATSESVLVDSEPREIEPVVGTVDVEIANVDDGFDSSNIALGEPKKDSLQRPSSSKHHIRPKDRAASAEGDSLVVDCEGEVGVVGMADVVDVDVECSVPVVNADTAVDVDEDVVEVEPIPHSLPTKKRRHATVDDVDDDEVQVVSCVGIGTSDKATDVEGISVVPPDAAGGAVTAVHIGAPLSFKRKRRRRSRASNCSACEKALILPAAESVDGHVAYGSDAFLYVSRCMHTLCHSCGVKAIAVTNSTSEDDGPLQATEPKGVPTCPVRRCRAPLSCDEARAALVPGAVDRMCTEAMADFRGWLACGATALATVSVTLPPFSEEMAEKALCVEGSDALGEWFTDDLRGAYGPLWVFEDQSPLGTEKETSDDECTKAVGVDDDGQDEIVAVQPETPGLPTDSKTQTIVWVCAACGLPESRGDGIPGQSAATAGDERDSSRPPLAVHCPYARAYGITQAVEGFAETSLSAEHSSAAGAAAPPKDLRKGRGRSRSKYASAARGRKYNKVGGFAKGTGYGGNAGQGEWRGLSKSYLEKVARNDAEMAYWLSRVRAFLVFGKEESLASWPLFMRDLLRDLNLVPYICRILVNESIMDVGERVIVYVAALRVVNALVDCPSLRSLVLEPNEAGQGRSVVSLVSSIGQQAALLSTGAGFENLDAKATLLIRQIKRCLRAIKRHGLLYASNSAAGAGKKEMILDLDADLDKLLAGCSDEDENGIPPDADLSTPPTDAEKEGYMNAMRKLQFETVPGLAELSVFYKGSMPNGSGTVSNGATMRRIATEVATLSASLPLSWSSTIILRVDEDRYDFLQAMITGPEGSPYSCGCFVFDIFLPPTYPNNPPKFQLLTTGGGKVRFNPNLYNCGKVCLSLLGTWSGPSWTPASTLLQVLVSIQSLILVDDPYFNEPGFESSMGTASGKTASENYNAGVRKNNVISAMIANLRNPPLHMTSAVQMHFRYKRRAVKCLIQEWYPQSSPSEAHATTAGLGAGAGAAAVNSLLGGHLKNMVPSSALAGIHALLTNGQMSGPGYLNGSSSLGPREHATLLKELGKL